MWPNSQNLNNEYMVRSVLICITQLIFAIGLLIAMPINAISGSEISMGSGFSRSAACRDARDFTKMTGVYEYDVGSCSCYEEESSNPTRKNLWICEVPYSKKEIKREKFKTTIDEMQKELRDALGQ